MVYILPIGGFFDTTDPTYHLLRGNLSETPLTQLHQPPHQLGFLNHQPVGPTPPHPQLPFTSYILYYDEVQLLVPLTHHQGSRKTCRPRPRWCFFRFSRFFWGVDAYGIITSLKLMVYYIIVVYCKWIPYFMDHYHHHYYHWLWFYYHYFLKIDIGILMSWCYEIISQKWRGVPYFIPGSQPTTTGALQNFISVSNPRMKKKP